MDKCINTLRNGRTTNICTQKASELLSTLWLTFSDPLLNLTSYFLVHLSLIFLTKSANSVVNGVKLVVKTPTPRTRWIGWGYNYNFILFQKFRTIHDSFLQYICNLFRTCSQLIQKIFPNLSLTCSILVHKFFIIFSWLVHKFFTFFWQLIQILFITFSQLD